MYIRLLLPILTLLLINAHTYAQTDIESIDVEYEIGASSATMEGRLVGEQIVDYKLRASGGQAMSVKLTTDHPVNYFNVLPPESMTALYNSSMGDNAWTGTLPEDGIYTVRVYMMRSAARRGETANYSLEIGITGDAKVTGTPFHATGSIACSIAPDPMESARCEFGVIRQGSGKADVHIDAPWGDKFVLKFDGDNVSTESAGTIDIERESDNWKVTINGSRHFTIPDAVINGG